MYGYQYVILWSIKSDYVSMQTSVTRFEEIFPKNTIWIKMKFSYENNTSKKMSLQFNCTVHVGIDKLFYNNLKNCFKILKLIATIPIIKLNETEFLLIKNNVI